MLVCQGGRCLSLNSSILTFPPTQPWEWESGDWGYSGNHGNGVTGAGLAAILPLSPPTEYRDIRAKHLTRVTDSSVWITLFCPCPPPAHFIYLGNKGSQHDSAEDWVPENGLKNIPLSMDLASIDLVEKLHHDKSVENDGVVLRGWGVEGNIPATVNVKKFLTYQKRVSKENKTFLHKDIFWRHYHIICDAITQHKAENNFWNSLISQTVLESSMGHCLWCDQDWTQGH